MKLSPFALGTLLTGIGVLILSPDAALIRYVDLDAWALLAWRGPALSLVMLLGLIILFGWRFVGQLRGALIGVGPLIAILFAISTNGFILGAERGDPAFTVVAVAATPLFAALFSKLIYGENIDRPTLIAIFLGIFGVGLGAFEVLGSQRGEMIGFIGASLIPMAMGLGFTLTRYMRAVQHVWGVYVLAGLITGATGLVMSGAPVLPDEHFGVFLCLIFVVGAGSFLLISIGPRYISAAQTSLMLLLETALSPVWVYFIVQEAPGPLTLIGGILLILTLIGQTLAQLRVKGGRN